MVLMLPAENPAAAASGKTELGHQLNTTVAKRSSGHDQCASTRTNKVKNKGAKTRDRPAH